MTLYSSHEHTIEMEDEEEEDFEEEEDGMDQRTPKRQCTAESLGPPTAIACAMAAGTSAYERPPPPYTQGTGAPSLSETVSQPMQRL